MALFFSFALFAISFLYLLVDYSTNFKLFKAANIQFGEIFLYFTARLGALAELFLPLAFSIAFTATLGIASAKNETIALFTSAIACKRFLRPFLISGVTASLILYLHFQFFYPALKSFEASFYERYMNVQITKKVHSLRLSDDSLLLYQSYDAKRELFFDVFWLRNLNEIYRMEKLYVQEIPRGIGMECYKREGHALTRVEKAPFWLFAEMPLDKLAKNEAIALDSLSLSALRGRLKTPFGFAYAKEGIGNKRSTEAASLFFYRLFAPLIPIFSVLALAPSILRFSRKRSLFPLFFLALSSLFVFFTITRASLILAQSEMLPPFWVIIFPFVCAFGISSLRYGKL